MPNDLAILFYEVYAVGKFRPKFKEMFRLKLNVEFDLCNSLTVSSFIKLFLFEM